MNKETFWLAKGDCKVRFEVLSDYHWKVIGLSRTAQLRLGDEVSPVRRIPWQAAKRRVNGFRTSMSPHHFVLLRGEGWERTDEEVASALAERPWDPEPLPVA